MERVQIRVDTSGERPPRGFLDSDKSSLDPVRREYMSRLRVHMLDFNEEYLATHPQVEGVLRLIVKEVLCHKPHDVRKFIRELLLSDNLETRVAKIILSQRINLERAHTREYFHHLAEWESGWRAGPEEEGAEEHSADGEEEEDAEGEERRPATEEWPGPVPGEGQPKRRRDRPEFSHLHYFKDPYWFYPKEFMKVKSPVVEDVEAKCIPRLPEWKSAFLKADFFQRWGDPFEPRSVPLSNPDWEAAKKKAKKYESPWLRRLRRRLRKERKEERGERKEPFLLQEPYGKVQNGGGGRGATEEITARESNMQYILSCETCRKAVAGLDRQWDEMAGRKTDISLSPLSANKKSLMNRPPKAPLQGLVEEMERSWKEAERIQVDTERQGLREVWAKMDEEAAQIDLREAAVFLPRWSIKGAGEEISFVVDSGEPVEPEPALHEEKDQLTGQAREVSARYKSPIYQLIIREQLDEIALELTRSSEEEEDGAVRWTQGKCLGGESSSLGACHISCARTESESRAETVTCKNQEFVRSSKLAKGLFDRPERSQQSTTHMSATWE